MARHPACGFDPELITAIDENALLDFRYLKITLSLLGKPPSYRNHYRLSLYERQQHCHCIWRKVPLESRDRSTGKLAPLQLIAQLDRSRAQPRVCVRLALPDDRLISAEFLHA